MAEQNAPVAGPDFTKGVAANVIAEGTTLLGHVGDDAVLLARCGGRLYAVAAHCTHYGGPLNEGLMVGETIRCPWHHAAFNLRTGRSLRPPALNDLPCWKVHEQDGLAFVTTKRQTPASVVILGGGAAGAVAAETLRREGYGGPVTIVEAGNAAPYDRPNLSKDYLAGTASEDWIPLRPDSFYTDNRIELLLNTRATAIDINQRQVTLDNGTALEFGALLIATGADPIVLPFPNAKQPVYYLRSLSDSRAIIAALHHAGTGASIEPRDGASNGTTNGASNGAGAKVNLKHAVVMGASFIGLEVAASLRTRGFEVTVVAPENRPLERVLGPELGDFIRATHERHGVIFKLGQTVSTIHETSVTLQNGEQVPANLVVAGIGVRPNTSIAATAGLAMDRGILVNEYLETSAPDIYAAGDIARWPDVHSEERIRVEHWVVAERHGQTAARNMLGRLEPFDAVPFFWSQHYDVAINYVGHAEKWDTITVNGDLAAGDAEITYRTDNKVLAVATVSRDKASLRAEQIMER